VRQALSSRGDAVVGHRQGAETRDQRVGDRTHGGPWLTALGGRSAVMNPFYSAEMWRYLREPDLADLEIA
jgi:hypothetical protein